eukprot:gb/GEZN01002786.1/.p1 GENE.gb/GEZN01002786.1/~~gb/GEZN01002786.1/.p1  ORF type:complete len:640 (-),score=87.21 gb/GEZN01002786.1/:356-2275(-)
MSHCPNHADPSAHNHHRLRRPTLSVPHSAACTLLCCSLVISYATAATAIAANDGHANTMVGTWSMHSVTPFGNATQALCDKTWTMFGAFNNATLRIEEETEEAHATHDEDVEEHEEPALIVNPDLCANLLWERDEDHDDREVTSTGEEHLHEGEALALVIHKQCGPILATLEALPTEEDHQDIIIHPDEHVHDEDEELLRVLTVNVSGPLDSVTYAEGEEKLTGFGGCFYEFEAPLDSHVEAAQLAPHKAAGPKTWFLAFCGVLCSCLVALLCMLVLRVCSKNSELLVFNLLAISTGTLLGAAFFSLLPEAIEILGFGADTAITVLVGVMVGLLSQQVLHKHHSHGEKEADLPEIAPSPTPTMPKSPSSQNEFGLEEGPALPTPLPNAEIDSPRNRIEDALYHVAQYAEETTSAFPDPRTHPALPTAMAVIVAPEKKIEITRPAVALDESLHAHAHGNHKDGPMISRDLIVMNLGGDALHSLIDGGVIGAAFLESHALGLTVTIAIILHELPQELGDYAMLVHAGLSPCTAAKWNFLVSLTAFIGCTLTLGIGTALPQVNYIIPFAVGLFLYLALAGLVPLLINPRINNPPLARTTFMYVLLGIVMMGLLSILLPGHSHDAHGAKGEAGHGDHGVHDNH